MHEMGIYAIYPKPKTSLLDQSHKIYPYLFKDVRIEKANQAWGTDITYIRMPYGFVYLVALIDIYSRYLLGWSLFNAMDVSFCESMFRESLTVGKPEILNSDQGAQFTSQAWIDFVESNDILVSMDGQGRWADNVFIERFWRSLKYENLLINEYKTVLEVRKAIKNYIDFYNNRRWHQSLGYKTPAEVYWKR